MCLPCVKLNFNHDAGELAQMVERSLSMREVPGSMPGFSNYSQSRNISNSFSSLLIASTVRMAERSKAPDSRGETLSISEHSGPRMWAWVRIPLLTPIFLKVVVPFSFYCPAGKFCWMVIDGNWLCARQSPPSRI